MTTHYVLSLLWSCFTCHSAKGLGCPTPSPIQFLSTDFSELENQPLGKLGWTCLPQSTPWRRHWIVSVFAYQQLSTDVEQGEV